MKKLNSYGEEFINEILNYGRIEDEQIYKKIDYISITESNTNFLINVEIVEHSESKYIYNDVRYIYHGYKRFICNEIFTISKRLTEDAKVELISNFCYDFSNYYEFEQEDISKDEYYLSNDLPKFKIRLKIENKILYGRFRYFRG